MFKNTTIANRFKSFRVTVQRKLFDKRSKVSPLALIFYTLLVTGCGGSDSSGLPNAIPPDDTINSPGTPTADTQLALRWHSVIDPFADNMEAAKLLVPDGWNISGGMQWNIGLRNGGVTRDLEIFSPDRTRGILFLPTRPYHWSVPAIPFFPQGSFYGTVGAYIEPPISAADYISQFVLPLQLNNATATSNIQSLPAVATALQQNMYAGLSASAARVRIRFDLNGAVSEGEVHTWAWYDTLPDGLGGDVTIWQPERVFMVYAPVGELDREIDKLYPLAVSEVVNPAWNNVVNEVEQLRLQGVAESIALAGQLSQVIAQNAQASFELISSVWRESNAVNDQVFDAYSQYIRGVESYLDPIAGEIELPGGYRQVWSDSFGGYIMTDDVLFDPNVTPAFSGNWSLLGRS